MSFTRTLSEVAAIGDNIWRKFKEIGYEAVRDMRFLGAEVQIGNMGDGSHAAQFRL